MSSQLAMSLMSTVEFLLSALLGFMFWKKGLQRRFPAMGSYLALRVISTPILSVLLMAELDANISEQMRRTAGQAYFFVFWAAYIVSAVLLFFICMEVFRSALSALPGLMKFGIVIFRWAAVVSLVVTFSSVSFRRGILSIPDIALGLMRSVSLLELCLLAFLCLSINALRLSVRDLSFGIALGFGLMSANDFIVVSLMSAKTGLTTPLQFVYQSIVLVALGIWVAYAALPELARRPVVMAANSTIYRWNEIASALGHPATQVAVEPQNGFFLTDVEKVVEKVLSRSSLKKRESES
jgi:hypothetical protein